MTQCRSKIYERSHVVCTMVTWAVARRQGSPWSRQLTLSMTLPAGVVSPFACSCDGGVCTGGLCTGGVRTGRVCTGGVCTGGVCVLSPKVLSIWCPGVVFTSSRAPRCRLSDILAMTQAKGLLSDGLKGKQQSAENLADVDHISRHGTPQ